MSQFYIFQFPHFNVAFNVMIRFIIFGLCFMS